jgi:hypothetical protein
VWMVTSGSEGLSTEGKNTLRMNLSELLRSSSFMDQDLIVLSVGYGEDDGYGPIDRSDTQGTHPRNMSLIGVLSFGPSRFHRF